MANEIPSGKSPRKRRVRSKAALAAEYASQLDPKAKAELAAELVGGMPLDALAALAVALKERVPATAKYLCQDLASQGSMPSDGALARAMNRRGGLEAARVDGTD